MRILVPMGRSGPPDQQPQTVAVWLITNVALVKNKIQLQQIQMTEHAKTVLQEQPFPTTTAPVRLSLRAVQGRA